MIVSLLYLFSLVIDCAMGSDQVYVQIILSLRYDLCCVYTQLLKVMEVGGHSARKQFTVSAGSDIQNELHHVVFAVKQLNLDAVEQKLNEISSPSSPLYGKYLSRDEVCADVLFCVCTF